MTLSIGQRIAVSKYHGRAYGVIVALPVGHVTAQMDDDNHLPGGSRETFDLSRRKIEVMQ